MIQELGQLASGEYVFDRPRSHLHGDIGELLAEVLAQIESANADLIVRQVDLKRVVGKRICVETSSADTIVFARRQNRKGLTRFVVGRDPEDCSSVVVVLKKDEYSETYVCITAYVGERSEPEPWDPHATENSVPFWQTHAMIWDGIGFDSVSAK